MPIQTHLINRNGTNYFRRRISLQLLQHYSPKLEIIFSLKTKDLKEAERLSRVESVDLIRSLKDLVVIFQLLQ